MLVIDFIILTAQVFLLGKIGAAPDTNASFHIISIVSKPSLRLQCIVRFVTRFAASQPVFRGLVEATHTDAVALAKCSDLRS